MALSEKHIKPSYDEVVAKLDKHKIKHSTYRNNDDTMIVLQAPLWKAVVSSEVFDEWHVTCVILNNVNKLVAVWQFEDGKLL